MSNLAERITTHPFFERMKPAHLAILASGAKEAQFNAGDILFREGEPASQFYLIERGSVAIAAHEPGNGTVLVQELGPGDVLGWSWLFAPFEWRFMARATEATTAIVLNGAHLLIAAEENHEFGYELMKRVAQVVIHRLQATRQQLLNLQCEETLKG